MRLPDTLLQEMKAIRGDDPSKSIEAILKELNSKYSQIDGYSPEKYSLQAIESNKDKSHWFRSINKVINSMALSTGQLTTGEHIDFQTNQMKYMQNVAECRELYNRWLEIDNLNEMKMNDDRMNILLKEIVEISLDFGVDIHQYDRKISQFVSREPSLSDCSGLEPFDLYMIQQIIFCTHSRVSVVTGVYFKPWSKTRELYYEVFNERALKEFYNQDRLELGLTWDDLDFNYLSKLHRFRKNLFDATYSFHLNVEFSLLFEHASTAQLHHMLQVFSSEEKTLLNRAKSEDESASTYNFFTERDMRKWHLNNAKEYEDDAGWFSKAKYLVQTKLIGPQTSNATGLNRTVASRVNTKNVNLDDIIGLHKVKMFLQTLEAQLKIRNERKKLGIPVDENQTLHMIFMGNPGTGKTMVARYVAQILYNMGVIKANKLIETDRSGLVAEYIGQTAIKTRNVVHDALDGVLFIDEAYSLVNDIHGGYGKEAIDTLVKEVDDNRDRLVVILAGYPNDMVDLLKSNPGLKSRFPNVIVFEDYDVDDLMEIAIKMFTANAYVLMEAANERMRQIFSVARMNPSFGNGRFVRNLYEDTLRNQSLRLSQHAGEFSKELLITIEADDIKYEETSVPTE